MATSTASKCSTTSNAVIANRNTTSIGLAILHDNRRTHAFKSLVSDVAEHLDNKDVKNICWQMDAPNSMQEKTALEVLTWLVKHGKFSEVEVRPLAELLKDIHREDLTGRVETFWEEFGKVVYYDSKNTVRLSQGG